MTGHISKLLEWIEDNTGIIPDSQEAVDAIVVELQAWAACSLAMSKRGERKLIGKCGVDSGQIMILDPCYLEDLPPYEDICEISLTEIIMGGQIVGGPTGLSEIGVVSQSGKGDGVYPVYAVYREGLIARLEIDFTIDLG